MINFEEILSSYKNFVSLLGYGASEAKTAEALYKSFKQGMMHHDEAIKQNKAKLMQYQSFHRIIRKLSEQARNAGIRIIHDNNGYFICQTEEEWNKFKEMEKGRAGSVLRQLAKCDNKKFDQFLRENFFPKQQKIDDTQLSLLMS